MHFHPELITSFSASQLFITNLVPPFLCLSLLPNKNVTLNSFFSVHPVLSNLYSNLVCLVPLPKRSHTYNVVMLVLLVL